MIPFIKKVEEALLEYAKNFTPKGINPIATVHQWSQAIATTSSLAGKPSIDTIINTLTSSGLFESEEIFYSKIFSEVPFPPNKNSKFKFIDLFAGIGGFRLALQEQSGLCVFSSEWDKSAQKTYYDNYGELPFGDITAFTASNIDDQLIDNYIPDHDVLCGGFPCQPFSHAGVSARTAVGRAHGFACNTQGTLFFDIMRIASVKKPKVLFLENVRNIENHNKGHTFNVIRESIDELGYDFSYEIIDASTLVPQRRVRCYMVCFRKDLNIDFNFPKFNGPQLALKEILEINPSKEFTISDRLWSGHINRTKRNIERGTGFTAYTANIEKPSKTLVARYGKDGKECLIPQENLNPRLLTPRECARLQGYPDKFLLPKSKTPAYKQFGNSVAVPVVSEIAKEISKGIL